ncbi:cytochrome c1 [Trinickia dinghuensis]|uniref:Cytochrome c1 n=1 Tax=Trinickia dinghuensis TaxID=2291023 RepID=A0A3D8JQW3_9BURK|nr:cytochrome c1 [Trinickia dinghuensis]RDU95499.1 cytochrome c1 [Trinickia dinghuensis]
MNTWLTKLARIGGASVALALAVAMAPAHADEDFQLDRAPNNTHDIASLQHGAQLFVNYCLNCHSAKLMRYSALEQIGISQKEIEQNLLFTTDKVGNPMTVAMRPDDAKTWFGVTPPDLSVEARARGSDWLYTYLRSFYRDDTRPTGWNNMVFNNVSMPNVLWQLQGIRTVKFEDVKDLETGEKTHQFVGFETVKPGTMSRVDYDAAVADLVAYLTWMSEPTQQTRRQLGVFVLIFLGVLTFFAWRLNASYWKDVQ